MASPPLGGASSGKPNYKATIDKTDFKEWLFEENNLKDFIVDLNNFSFKKDKHEGTFIRLEKCPPCIYGVVINEAGQSEKQFWKELNRQNLKLVKIGLTRQEVKKGIGNRMEAVEDQIKQKVGFTSSTIFCLMIDFTTRIPFKDVEKNIRSKVGIKLNKESAKQLKLPMPTEWVLTSQDSINSLKDKIKKIKAKCIENDQIYTTAVMESYEHENIEGLVQEIDPQCLELRNNEIVYHNEEDSLVKKFIETLGQIFSVSYWTTREQENEN